MPYADKTARNTWARERRKLARERGEVYKQSGPSGLSIKQRERKERRKHLYDMPSGDKPELPRFVGIDGEGTNRDMDEMGEDALPQDYTLLCMTGPFGSAGKEERKWIEYYGPGGLSTEACLKFLLGYGWNRGLTYVAYFFNYDTTKILHDLSEQERAALWHGGWCVWRSPTQRRYYIKWIPGKLLELAEYKGTNPEHINKHTDFGRSLRIYDVSGFYQKSFVSALETWGIGKELGSFIEEMKGRRNDFKSEEKDEIRRYCLAECDMLRALMDKLAETLWQEGIYLQSWHGAGAIAGELMKMRGVKDHLEQEPDDVTAAVMGGYYGGRMEVFRQGVLPEGLYNADLQSAYPFAALTLPRLVGCRWTRVRHYLPGEPYALYRVLWDTSASLGNRLLGPFPYRKKGRVTYPLASRQTEGEGGWYHGCEVVAAIEVFGVQCFTVVDGWVLTPSSDERPFTPWVENLLIARLKYKADGNPRHIVLKLGCNSLYGKLAQAQIDIEHSPPFLSYYWAGLITAQTRATMLRAAYAAGEGLVAIATDGIFSTRPLDFLPAGTEPGSWEKSDPKGPVVVLQPGVMYSEVKKLVKTRGFSGAHAMIAEPRPKGYRGKWEPKEHQHVLGYDDFIREWERAGPFGSLTYDERRFVGMGACVARGDYRHYGRWVRTERKLNFSALASKWYTNPTYNLTGGARRDAEYPGTSGKDNRIPESIGLVPMDSDSGGSDPFVPPHLLDEELSRELLAEELSHIEQFDQPDWEEHEVIL